MMKRFLLIFCAFFATFLHSSYIHAEDTVIRIGHFPNLTHAHGLIAHHRSRTGTGWFETRLGAKVKVEWYLYNAGPSAMEALMVGAIDFAYVGPNPAINAFVRTKGEEVRILSGATSGGSALVVQGDSNIERPSDFRGKTIATPQLGNTQDVAARAWLIKNGIAVTQTGGDARVVPTENPEQLSLFLSHKLDAVWTVEPWVSRLEMEAKGKIFLVEKDALTTVLVARAKVTRENPELVKAFLAAHNELSQWIVAHSQEAQAEVQAELEAETSRSVSSDLVKKAWQRMHFSGDISKEKLQSFVTSAQAVGFLKDAGDLSGIFYTAK